jgi:mannosyltransferase
MSDPSAGRPFVPAPPGPGLATGLGFVLLAAAIRLPGLGRASLWWDECNSVRVAEAIAAASPARVLAAIGRGLSTYFLMLAPWTDRTTTEWVVRLPSVAAGVGLVLALLWFGREIGSPRLGVVLGFAGAVSPFLVWHAREARWYSFTWTLIAVGAACFVRALRTGSRTWVSACLASGLLAASTFAPAIVTVGVEMLWLAGRRRPAPPGPAEATRPGIRRRMTATVVIAILAITGGLWIWLTVLQPALDGGPEGYRFRNVGGPKPAPVAYTAVAFATGYTLGPGPLEWHTVDPRSMAPAELGLLALGAIILMALAGAGFRTLWRTAPAPIATAVLTLAVVPPLVILAACYWTQHAYAPRHTGIAIPFVLALAGAAFTAGRPGRRAAIAGVVLIGLQALALWNLHADPRYLREDIRDAARLVASRAAPDDQVLVFGGIRLPWEHYYRGDAAWTMVYARGSGASSPDRVVRLIEGRRHVWTVEGRLWEEPGSEALIAVVGERARRLESHALAGGVRVSGYGVTGPGN